MFGHSFAALFRLERPYHILFINIQKDYILSNVFRNIFVSTATYVKYFPSYRKFLRYIGTAKVAPLA